MENKRKEHWKILRKLIGDDWRLFVLAIVGLFLLFMCKIPCLQIKVSFPESVTTAINDVVFCLAGSYVGGYIIYFLSSLIPKTKKIRPILETAVVRIRYALNTMEYDLKNTICQENGNEEVTVQKIKDGLTEGGRKIVYESDSIIALLEEKHKDTGDNTLIKAIEDIVNNEKDSLCRYEIPALKLKYVKEEILEKIDYYLEFVYTRSDYLDNQSAEDVRCIMNEMLKLHSWIDTEFDPTWRKNMNKESNKDRVSFNGMDDLANGLITIQNRLRTLYKRISKIVEEEPCS